MAENSCCPSCGKQRPANTPQGLCPECLLRQGMESEATSSSHRGEPEASVAPNDQFHPHLGGEPVKGGPPSNTVRLRKFTWNYRPWLLTAAALAAVVALATGIFGWQAFRVSLPPRNRALDAEMVVNEQTDRAKQQEHDLSNGAGQLQPMSTLERIVQATRRKTASLLGSLVDPDKDCKFTKDEGSLKFTIEIPGDKIHTLAPEAVTLIKNKKVLHNAPMSLIEVEGDFAAVVQVTGEMSSGSTRSADLEGSDIPFTFHGAGLLLYHDRDNFVRLERTAGVSIESLEPIHKILFEVVRGGKNVDVSYPPVPEGPVYLLLMRRKGRVVCGSSLNLTAPFVPIKAIKLDLPSKVKIGLSASNISAKAFAATFENFAVFNDVTNIDAQFGDIAK